MRIFSIFFLAIIILGYTGCGGEKPKPTPLSDQPVAHFPQMVVGDTIVLGGLLYCLQEFGTDDFTLKIIEVKTDGSFVYEVKGKQTGYYHFYYNNKYQLEKVIDIDTKKEKEINIADPPQKILVFPLFVGKKWRDTFDIFGSNDPVLYSVTCDCTVDKYETVNTKAGSFKAFRITRQLSITEKVQWEGQARYWYAPAVKSIVKVERDWAEGNELISYTLAAADTTPPVIEITSPNLGGERPLIANTKYTAIRGIVRDESGIQWTRINNVDITLNESGEFAYMASIRWRENVFEVVASDIHGNEARKTVTILTPPQLCTGKVTSIHGDVIELNVGTADEIKVGDTGRVFYEVATVAGEEKPMYIANFRITHISGNSSMALIENKKEELKVGYLVEVSVEAKQPQGKRTKGFITFVKGSTIFISLGKNDGVKIGDVFEVYKDKESKGRIAYIKVTSVDLESSAGEIQEKTQEVDVGYCVEIFK